MQNTNLKSFTNVNNNNSINITNIDNVNTLKTTIISSSNIENNLNNENESKSLNNSSDSCNELKNLKYKSMLLNGTNIDILTTTKETSNNMDSILNAERECNLKEPWGKLDKTVKIVKIKNYVDNLIKNKNNLTLNETDILKNYLINSLDKKKLHKVKDVLYNINTGEIENIPSLYFNDSNRKFTLKRNDKKQSTSKSLGPKTRKNLQIENQIEKSKTEKSKTEKFKIEKPKTEKLKFDKSKTDKFPKV